MAEICVRKVSPELHYKIKNDSLKQMKSMGDYVIGVLENHFSDSQPDFFDRSIQQDFNPSGMPLKFIDLFAGIGGFRIGLERIGAQCVFTSEWDVHSQKTYKAWHGDVPHGDITQIATSDIPEHDILCAGFPCQPFSLAGVSKKNSLGRNHGFKDETQGTLFFHLVSIAEVKRPPIMILENVKNLMSHDKGRTWQVIQNNLEALNYQVFAKVIDAKYWVPQHRERIFIVCFDREKFGNDIPFEFPIAPESTPRVRDILESQPDDKYTLSNHLWTYLQNYAEKHRLAGNGFGFGLVDLDSHTRTLSARYHKDGSEILIPQQGKNPRRLTPIECQRLMGYPDYLSQVVSDTQAYRQFGNSVVPTIVEAIGRKILEVVNWHISNSGSFLNSRIAAPYKVTA